MFAEKKCGNVPSYLYQSKIKDNQIYWFCNPTEIYWWKRTIGWVGQMPQSVKIPCFKVVSHKKSGYIHSQLIFDL